MKRLVYSLILLVLLFGIVLTAYAPDGISTVFILFMELIIIVGVLFGVIPVVQYYRGFESGMDNIDRALEVQTNSTWAVITQMERFFHQKFMDEQFVEYQEKVQSQRESGLVLSDIDEYFNEDIFGLRAWQNVVMQIPGMLTSLGILGTFIGLIVGIQGIGFSSVNAALSSVQTLLSGIQVAFYTSIAGVILSLIFNFTYRIAWNMLARNLGLFIDVFHKNVIPSTEEQIRYRERKEMKRITELLERLPKSGQFSVSHGGATAHPQQNGNEQILMPQILQGLRDGEFIFYLQPRFDLNTQKVVGAEALVRWNHGKLGMVSPAVFIPVLESNGYITRLDQYIWEQVCATIRRWIDSNIRPVPLSINVTKTDVLAIDIVEFLNDMLKKYRIPPRYLEIEIAQNAYLQSSNAVLETESQLRQSGFRVVMDGFEGDFIALNSIPQIDADILKLDLRRLQGNITQGALNLIFDQARNLKLTLAAEGIENMEQMNMLKKCGCSEGQGFFLSKPISLEDFESVITGGTKPSAIFGKQSKQPSDEPAPVPEPEPEKESEITPQPEPESESRPLSVPELNQESKTGPVHAEESYEPETENEHAQQNEDKENSSGQVQESRHETRTQNAEQESTHNLQSQQIPVSNDSQNDSVVRQREEHIIDQNSVSHNSSYSRHDGHRRRIDDNHSDQFSNNVSVNTEAMYSPSPRHDVHHTEEGRRRRSAEVAHTNITTTAVTSPNNETSRDSQSQIPESGHKRRRSGN